MFDYHNFADLYYDFETWNHGFYNWQLLIGQDNSRADLVVINVSRVGEMFIIGPNTLSDMIVKFLEAWSINLSLQWLKVAQRTTYVGVANCELTVMIVNTDSPPTRTSAGH